jgi:hypothetical protein
MFISIGKLLKIPTPVCHAIIGVGEAISGINFRSEGKRTLQSLGLGDLSIGEIKSYLETGELPTTHLG